MVALPKSMGLQDTQYTDPLLLAQINEKLKEFGQSLDGRPVWRVSWSSTEMEKRRGWHEEYTPSGNIFIRKWFGVKNCLKYNYMMDRYVLERLTFLGDNMVAQQELVEARQGTYEPVYCFQDAHGNPLSVNWRIIDAIMSTLAVGAHYESPMAREEMKTKMEELEVEEMEGYLGEEGRSPLFAFEQHAVLDSTKQKMWERK